MRVIDFHLHPAAFDDAPAHYDEFIATYQGDPQAFYQRYNRPEQLRMLLEENGIAHAVVLAKQTPITTGVLDNEHVLELAAANPALIPFASIDPYTQREPGREMERLIRAGIRGLKVYPTYQYVYPNDPILYPVYDVCQAYGVPVLVHTGSSVFAGSRIKYGNPLDLDDVARDFPDLGLVMAHGGRPIWYREAAALVLEHEHVYIDLAGLPPKRLPTYFPNLAEIAHKLVFGSDWPGIPGTIRDNVEAINALPLDEAVQRRIFWDNAARLLPAAALHDDRIRTNDRDSHRDGQLGWPAGSTV